ncbi:MAG: hypothetical protein JNL67_15670 [Planctomycetaceae bacterium]|nr:hypothetical protein [Planctomycetaceae bacterium]
MWNLKSGLVLLLGGMWFLSDLALEQRENFETLSPEEQREMVRKWERFSALSATEQAKWRAFDEQLAARPDAARLRAVMDQYYEWNLGLSDRDRANLTADSVDKRMELVQKIRLRQYEENLANESTRLTLDELKIFTQWGREVLQRPDRTPVPPNQFEARMNAQLDDLQSRFSGKTAELMEQKRGKIVDGRDERWILVMGWFQDLRRPTPTMLKSVYESLTDEEKIALTELPEMTPDAINAKLREYYNVRMELPGFFGMRNDSRGPRRPRGPLDDEGRPPVNEGQPPARRTTDND